jgi:hypothetical protein
LRVHGEGMGRNTNKGKKRMPPAKLMEKQHTTKTRAEPPRARAGVIHSDSYLAEQVREMDAIKQQISALNRKLSHCHDQLIRRGYNDEALHMLNWRRDRGEDEANRTWALAAHYFEALKECGK